jgi:hypothetical protein
MSQSVARGSTAGLPAWISPQFTQLVEAAPDGGQWLHEIKYDGYRMHARLDRGTVKMLTRRAGSGFLRESLREACRGHRLETHRCVPCATGRAEFVVVGWTA